MEQRKAFAVVHGRFQPFHREHLTYCLWALEHGETLVVGITNYDRAAAIQEPASTHRHTDASNPFAYWERALMVRDSLLDAGVPPQRFSIVALPIHRMDRWSEHVPTDPATSLHLLRVFSAWEEEKVARLRDAGLPVEAVRGQPKLISASAIRARIARSLEWRADVPTATARWIVQFDGERRIQALSSSSPSS